MRRSATRGPRSIARARLTGSACSNRPDKSGVTEGRDLPHAPVRLNLLGALAHGERVHRLDAAGIELSLERRHQVRRPSDHGSLRLRVIAIVVAQPILDGDLCDDLRPTQDVFRRREVFERQALEKKLARLRRKVDDASLFSDPASQRAA